MNMEEGGGPKMEGLECTIGLWEVLESHEKEDRESLNFSSTKRAKPTA